MKAIVRVHYARPPHHALLDLAAAFNVDRALVVQGRGKFAFEVPAADIELGARGAARFGDIVTIESTVRGIRPYVGVITEISERAGSGAVEISGDNYGSILYGMALDRSASFGGGSTGAIASGLLKAAQSGGRSVYLESGALGGDAAVATSGRLEFGGQTLGAALDALVDRFDNEWWITHSIRRAGLRHFLNVGRRRGADLSRSVVLEEGRDFARVEYKRDALGQVRSVIAVGGGSEIFDRPAVAVSTAAGAQAGALPRVEDALAPRRASSIGERDVYEYRPFDTDPAILASVARRRFMNPTTAGESLSITAALSRCGNVAPGDRIALRFHSIRSAGAIRLARVYAMQPAEDSGECDLEVFV